MEETFRIYIHRLRDGHIEKIAESVSADFMEVKEAELAFNVPVVVNGEASVVDHVLVLKLNIETEATMPCSICNQDIQVKISIHNFCHTEEVENIKGAIFDYREILREAILLALPFTAECNQGDCPERSAMAQYVTQNKDQENSYGSPT